jgi:superkiller protein 3
MLGKYESAVEAYKKFTRLRPKNPLGHLELGFAYEALAAQGSADLNEPFINLENIQPEQIKDLWLIYRNDSAVNEWLSAGLTADDFLTTGKTFSEDEKYTEALTWYRRALWVAIDSAPTWIALADTLEESGNPQQARNAYWAAYFFNPEAGATDLVKALDSQIEASLIETILTKALQDYPQSDQRYDWWNILTSTLAEEERWSDVERISRQAIDENPAWSEFYIDLGWAIYNQKADWKSAIREFEKAIEINKSEPEGYFAIARLLTMESRYPEADPYYVLAIERKPGDRWYQVSWATNTRNSGNIPLAVEIFERILVQYPDYSQAYYEAALAYYLNKQLDKAKDAIEQAISLLNYQDQWYFTRAGAIFEAAGDINQALDYYQQALEVNPRNTTALEGVSRLGE